MVTPREPALDELRVQRYKEKLAPPISLVEHDGKSNTFLSRIRTAHLLFRWTSVASETGRIWKAGSGL